ncbi:secreted RxLR effector protein 161-like [Lathyrus oleraceus]|uniref:secreted RxLR effector protein 161-like n=1 Tax=Pisum sativum TaxID=3888 RepID=UPI0021CF0575|nr:secreted RxLR effector protein 161-like [Pisum sativum]
MFSVCLCARFQANPEESHLTAVKRIMKYLKGTTNVGLWYPKGSICKLVGYSDAYYAGCKTDRKSTSGTCHILGNALVSWACKKQACVALSTAEAEYIAADFYPELVKVFYSNMVRKKGKLTSVVKGVPISLTASDICAIFEIPPVGHKFVGTIAPWENYSKHAFTIA